MDWIQKHIFPGSLLLSVGRVNEALNRTGDLFLHRTRRSRPRLCPHAARVVRAHSTRGSSEVRARDSTSGLSASGTTTCNTARAAFAMRNISVVQAALLAPEQSATARFSAVTCAYDLDASASSSWSSWSRCSPSRAGPAISSRYGTLRARSLGHPWFIATLFDTYFAFFTFWLWVAYKQRDWLKRIAWLRAILLLGNIAMATYMLIQLFRLPADAKIEELLLRRCSERVISWRKAHHFGSGASSRRSLRSSTQGVTPEKIAFTIALGIDAGCFPDPRCDHRPLRVGRHRW